MGQPEDKGSVKRRRVLREICSGSPPKYRRKCELGEGPRRQYHERGKKRANSSVVAANSNPEQERKHATHTQVRESEGWRFLLNQPNECVLRCGCGSWCSTYRGEGCGFDRVRALYLVDVRGVDRSSQHPHQYLVSTNFVQNLRKIELQHLSIPLPVG
jgi:hypothetical protein